MKARDLIDGQPLPLARLLGIAFDVVEPERVVARMIVRDDLCTLGGSVHGGALMALADTAGAIGAFVNLPEGCTATTTIDSKTNFIAGAKAGTTLLATASPVHRGRRTQVWQTRIETGDGRLVALVIQTQLML